MDDIELDLRNLHLNDTLTWDDEPLVGELLVALRSCAGQRVKVRIFQHHKSVGPNWGHSEEEKMTIVINCQGGCGKTTDDVNNEEFWRGKVEQVEGTMVPAWTCKECVETAEFGRAERAGRERASRNGGNANLW